MLAATVGQLAGTQVQGLLQSVLGPWLLAVLNEAPRRWLPVVSSGQACANDAGCGQPAIGLCVLCGRPVCLNHATVAISAEIVCFDCVRACRPHIKPWRAPEPAAAGTNGMSVDDACDLLGLEPDDVQSGEVSGKELKRAYRRASAEVHPDSIPNADASARRRAAVRFRQVQQAYDLLKDRAA